MNNTRHVLCGIETIDSMLGDVVAPEPAPGLRLGTMAHIRSATCPGIFWRLAERCAMTAPRTIILTGSHYSLLALSATGMLSPRHMPTEPAEFAAILCTSGKVIAQDVVWTHSPAVEWHPFRMLGDAGSMRDTPPTIVLCELSMRDSRDSLLAVAIAARAKGYASLVAGYYPDTSLYLGVHDADVALEQQSAGRFRVNKHRRAPCGHEVPIDPTIFP